MTFSTSGLYFLCSTPNSLVSESFIIFLYSFFRSLANWSSIFLASCDVLVLFKLISLVLGFLVIAVLMMVTGGSGMRVSTISASVNSFQNFELCKFALSEVVNLARYLFE